MQYGKMIAGGLAAFTLAACGGSSTSGSATSYQELFDQGAAFAAATDTSTDPELRIVDYTDPTTLPSSGSATYDGVLLVSAVDLGQAIGALELTADFASDGISGNVTNVFTEAEEQLSGTLVISNGAIDRTVDTETEFTFDADIDGNLVGEDGTFVVDAELVGDFLNADHGYVEGPVGGVITLGDEVFPISDGAFIAER